MSYVFLTGGARSGKSAAALELVSSESLVYFVATGRDDDEEMHERITRHRDERPAHWQTIEEPRALAAVIAPLPDRAAVVLDCLTLWVANLIASGSTDAEVIASGDGLADMLARRPGPAVVVSNEVGSGIVPMEALSRRYRDLLGRLNVGFAARASQAHLVVAGRLLELLAPGMRSPR
jgi:adenosylcobinamide kinase/adenosylcobinamide-phosphate guanylyltransferase